MSLAYEVGHAGSLAVQNPVLENFEGRCWGGGKGSPFFFFFEKKKDMGS